MDRIISIYICGTGTRPMVAQTRLPYADQMLQQGYFARDDLPEHVLIPFALPHTSDVVLLEV